MKRLIYTTTATLATTTAFGTASAQEATQAATSNSNPDLMLLYILLGMATIFLIVIAYLSSTIKNLTSNAEWIDKMLNNKTAKAILAILAFGLPASSMAQTAAAAPFVMGDELFWALISINALLFMVIIFMFFTIKNVIRVLTGQHETQKLEALTETSAIGSLMESMNYTVPIEREHEILTDHDYDGIQELDNNLPPWWVWGFYVTIIFGVIYMFYYHVYQDGNVQINEYTAAMQEAEEAKAAYMANMAMNVDESNVTLVTEASRLSSAKDIYVQNCAACHGAEGQGGVGPNLTDDYWLHGGTVADVFKTIKYGVPAKGMISWEAQFSPVQIQDLASYIATMQGTNPPNPKEPQGEKMEASAPTPTEPAVPATTTEEVQQAGI